MAIISYPASPAVIEPNDSPSDMKTGEAEPLEAFDRWIHASCHPALLQWISSKGMSRIAA
jgi:hypothetical protein